MRAHEIEDWTLRVIEQVESGQPNEDYRVELKAQWPNVKKAARHIAGHANAAHGEPILWLIGVDEEKGVVGVNNEELANWSAQVRAEFDGIAPQILRDLNVPVKRETVVALLFDTNRAPYLVKNPAYGQPNGGPVQLEVPWREARSIRTASRSDLLRILSPIQRAPSFELLNAWLKVYPELGGLNAYGGQTYSDDPKSFTWKLHMDFYVVPRTDARVVIPFHRCSASFEIPGHIPRTQFESIVMQPLSSIHGGGRGHTMRIDSLTIESTKYEVVINGPGKIMLQGEVDLPKVEVDSEEDIRIRVSLLPVDAEHSISFFETLHKTSPNEQRHELACWSIK
jgi:hypothetical protein